MSIEEITESKERRDVPELHQGGKITINELIDSIHSRLVIGNKRHSVEAPNGYIRIYGGRPSPLGNPFWINKEKERDRVCDLYSVWLNEQYHAGHEIKYVIDSLIRRLLNDEKIALVCWCYPKRCHLMEIPKFIKILLEEQLLELY